MPTIASGGNGPRGPSQPVKGPAAAPVKVPSAARGVGASVTSVAGGPKHPAAELNFDQPVAPLRVAVPRGPSGIGAVVHSAAGPKPSRALAIDAGLPKGYKLPPMPKSGGGGGLGDLLASVVSPEASIGSGLVHVAGNLGKDIISLPKSTLEGVTQLGGSALDDLEHRAGFGSANLRLSSLSPGSTGSVMPETAHMLSQAAHQDPLYNLATGHPGRAAQLAEAHPLGAILDATGAYGAVGKGLGAVSRLGSGAEDLARPAVEAAPGIAGTAEARSYSPNYFTAKVQRAMDANPDTARTLTGKPITDRLGLTGSAGKLRKQVAMFYGPEKSRIARDVQDTAKALKADKPAGKVEAAVTPYVAAFGGGHDTLQGMLGRLRDAQAGSEGPLRPSTTNLQDQHIANLTAAENKPNLDLGAIQHAATGYANRQAALESQKAALGLNEDPEMARALEKQYALARIPGTHFMPKEVVHPDSIAELRQAASDLHETQNTLRQAEEAAASSQGAHAGASRAVSDATKRLPLSPVNDGLHNHLLDLRSAIEETRAARKAQDSNTIAALKDQVDSAQKEHDLIQQHPKKLGGLVVEDPHALPVRSGPMKGMQLRELTSEEIRNHMAANGDNPSYVRMTNPDRERPLTIPAMRADQQAASAATGKAYTGQAAAVGDWTPGYRAMVRSQLGDVMNIGAARMEQRFLGRFGLKGPDGEHFTPHNWEEAAARYEQSTGVPVVPIADRAAGADKIVLVPKAAADELRAQLKLENPGKIAKGAMRMNRAFRNTVLPMSPKLPVMHTVENVSRGALAGATPQSFALARSVLSHMDETNPEAAARLRDLATPGGMGGHQASLDEEDLGRLTANHSAIRNAAATPGRLWGDAAHHIIGFQRAIEQHAQTAALGVHMRKTLQEMGHTWSDANTAVSKYADSLARGYQDPALAEAAGNYVHKTMGQYNNFTAKQRFVFSRIAPFAPWYKNAASLVWHGLPAGHPLKTALLSDVAKANQPAWDQSHAGLPADLQTAVNIGPGHWLDAGKFTPIGIEKNPVEEGVPLLFPQYTGAALALYGKDPYGNDMKGPNTAYGKSAVAPLSGAAVLHAADSLLGGLAGPTEAVARIVEEHGATPYNTSMPLLGQVQLKPGTQHGPANLLGGLNRVLNPFAGVWYNNLGSAAPASGQLPSGIRLKGSAKTFRGNNLTLHGNSITLGGK